MMFQRSIRIFLLPLLFAFSHSAFSQDVQGASDDRGYHGDRYQGGLHFGYIWFNNLQYAPGGSLGAAYWCGDAGLLYHITKPWVIGPKFTYGSELGNFTSPAASEFFITLET